MNNISKMLQDMERRICATAGLDEPDFEDIYHSCSDAELEAQYLYDSWQKCGENCTPLKQYG